MKSWRTTTTAICGILALLAPAVSAQIDGNPLTDPNWQIVGPACIVALQGLFARDNKVTSKQAGAE